MDEKRIREIFEKVASGLPLRLPVSTYRLQFNNDFTFDDARSVVPYLDDLGITDLYASPYFKAQPGSTHGYDVVDQNALNPEVGTYEEYQRMVNELKGRDMGLIADIVPNHMSIVGSENSWWNDVLENGQSSPYAAFFDIDWKPVKEELEDRVILPILGGQYGDVLERQEIRLVFESGAFYVNYWEHKLPVDPSTYDMVLSHRIEKLEEVMGTEDPSYQELLSIITSLRNLPHRTEQDPDRVTERLREKDVAKKRLNDLYGSSPEFKSFLDENVSIFNGDPEDPDSFDLLDRLLSAQVYRLSFWRVATEEINYRRFFDINDLGAIRMEDEKVFGEAHRLVFDLVRRGFVTGFRVDHPDGLYNPPEYFRRLQEGAFTALCTAEPNAESEARRFADLYREALANEPGGPLDRPFYIVGEKILMESERLSTDWPIYGTTGYSFMNLTNGVLIDSTTAKEMEKLYSGFTRQAQKFPEIFYGKKKLIMKTTMASEINVLGHRLNRISERDRHFRDFTLNSLINAIVEVIAFFPVYRTYISAAGINDSDRRYIEVAISKAKRRSLEINPAVYDFLRDVLLLAYPRRDDPSLRRECLEFTMKFQQLTGPVMAKGIEDTAFYNYNRLISVNEVGGNPERLGVPPDAFHGQNIERQKAWPFTMKATSTHDSKRSEDARARISVVSEFAPEWRGCVIRWAGMNKKFKGRIEGRLAPDRNEEYLLYQNLMGVWPIGETAGEAFEDFIERIKQYMVKALREAKTNSSWLNPNTEYEDAVAGFSEKVLRYGPFLEDVKPFLRKVEHYGMFNSLSQLLLKITSPGVPDFYQGTELWTLSLVDPDNRRPVDYDHRMRLLDELRSRESSTDRAALAGELLGSKADGRIKLYVTYRGLNFRRENRGLMERGTYMPLHTSGSHAEQVIAYCQFSEGAAAITIVPRLVSKVCGLDGAPVGEAWGDTLVHIPQEASGGVYRDIFTDETVAVSDHNGVQAISMRDALSVFPVALLRKEPR
jgi:(1->4)-alpha-D-glucan 1-alpha-D-glucosylmutase